MAVLDKAQFRTLLYLALESPIGILVATNDFARARSTFYIVRRELQDPALDILEFRPHPESKDQLIIVKKGSSSAEEEID